MTMSGMPNRLQFFYVTLTRYHVHLQELSYRKQIARQLRTQYAEGICRPRYYTRDLEM